MSKKILTATDTILMQRLRTCRLASDLSQKEVAIRVGIGSGAICSWEAGRTSPGPEDLVKLSTIYKVSVDYLFGNDLKLSAPKKPKEPKHIDVLSVPLVSLERLVHWDFSEIHWHVQVTEEYAAQSVAAVNFNAASPFPGLVERGDTLLVQRGDTIVEESIYFVKEEGNKIPVLRRAISEAGKLMFFAEDNRFTTLQKSNVSVVGKVIEVIRRTKL